MSLIGSSVEEKIWNYLLSKGLNKFGAAGLMGNLYAESGLRTDNLENLCEKRLKEAGKSYYTDELYTKAVDDGVISRAEFLNPLPGKQYGYGLAQWTSPGRKAGLYDLVKSKSVSIADLETQLEFLYKELSTSYKSVLSVLKSASSIQEASDIVLVKFESPANTGASVKAQRAGYGKKYYDKYSASSSSSNGGSKMTESELRAKVVSIAKQYLGCNEGDGSHRKIIDGYNAVTPLPRSYKVTYTDAWCATFVSFVGIKAGLSDIMFRECGCGAMVQLYQKAGRWVENDAYVPKSGDIIMYYWKDSGAGDCTGYPDHVGIVVSVSGNTIKVIEGNKNDSVCYRDIAVNGRYIRGYCIPNYASKATSSEPVQPSNPSTPSSGSTGKTLCKDVQWTGIVMADELSVRTWAGKSNAECSFSPLKNGAEVGVCDSEKASDGSIWYYIKYNGKYGFVHSGYVKKKAASTPVNSGSSSGSSSSLKVDYAESYSKSIAGTYKTTDGLNMRAKAGVLKNDNIITVIPKGGKVTCYGYYTSVSGTKWYLVVYGTKTGFVSSKYLTR